MSLPTKPCHTCRRRRLRCDRSLPQCHKCTTAGHECLGYQALFIWTAGAASRGKMTGVTYEDMRKQKLMNQTSVRPEAPSSSITSTPQNLGIAVVSSKPAPSYNLKSIPVPSLDRPTQLFQAKHNAASEDDAKLLLARHLPEPHLEDLNQDAKFYISYFNLHVCKDLILYDIPGHNPFRDLIPLATQHAGLLNIIIANSALHLSNTSQRPAVKSFSACLETHPSTRFNSKPLMLKTSQSTRWYQDALTAKHHALRLLNSALNAVHTEDTDLTLASVLLFIEFELADCAQKDWRLHINGARAIINSANESLKSQYSSMGSLRRCLISNCLVYDILGSGLARSMPSSSPHCTSSIVRSSLRDAEANNYLSFPAILLRLMAAATRLSHTDQGSFTENSITSSQGQLLALLERAQSFDALDWASSLQNTSPRLDLESRVHIASAHKAAVCIFISRVLLFLSPTTKFDRNLEPMVSEIINNLSFVTSNSELFKATSWPTFVAGAETNHPDHQAWAMVRLHELWNCLPCTMGYARSAMEILECIWNKRDASKYNGTSTVDWIQELKGLEIDCMIA